MACSAATRVASGDRLDDLRVLRVRALRAAGQEHGPVLKAHELRAQRLGQPLGRIVARELEDPAVEPGVDIRGGEQVSALAQLAHLGDHVA